MSNPHRRWIFVTVACTAALVGAMAVRGMIGLGRPLSERALRTRLFAFAADSMRGRAAGLPDNNRATDYSAREFAAAGLEPAGDNGSFFQSVPLTRRVYDSTSSISVNGHRLAAYTDYLPRDGGPTARSVDGKRVIFGGRW